MTCCVGKSWCVLAAVVAVSPVSAQQNTIVFSDDFSTIRNWVYFDSSRVRVVNGKLVVEDEQTVIAYFSAPGGGKQTVGPNESLQVSLKLSHADLEDQRRGIRIGLFDSNAAPLPPASLPSTSDRVFQGYDGYLFSWNPAPESGGNSLQLRYRTPGGQSGEAASTSLMESFEDTFSRRGIIAGTAPPLTFFAEGTDYLVTYTISRGSTSELSLTLSITGGNAANFSRTSIVSAPSTTEFNALALYSDGGVSSFTIDNVLITYTAVPEPSTYAACAGAAVLGLAFWRRRRAASKAPAA